MPGQRALTLSPRPGPLPPPQVGPDAISGTMRAISTSLDASRVFACRAAGRGYALKCIVCYVRSHYQAFAFSQELGRWLLFDDADVTLAGEWADVVAAVQSRSLQPSLLFYEAQGEVAAAAAAPAPAAAAAV